MSNFVFVNCGQCGNQLGFTLLDSLYSHLSVPSPPTSSSFVVDEDVMEIESNIFFRLNESGKRRYARAVCLDTEPKVVNECLARANKNKSLWSYDAKSTAYRHGGAGNNWAMGYEMCSGDFLELALNNIRKELEYCDQLSNLILTHSVAGGTGSGLGTHMTESIEDQFPDVTKINIAITPYHFGEVVVQHYNAVLCLSKISSSSDGVLLFENEVAHDLCAKMRGIARPTISDINSIIAANIVPILLPKADVTNQASNNCRYQPKSSFGDDITHLCSHPGYRFLDVKNTPQTSSKSIDFTYDSWSSIMRTLEKMQLRGTASERGLSSASTASTASNHHHKSIGSVLILRGPDSQEAAFATNMSSPQFPDENSKFKFQHLQPTRSSSHPGKISSALSPESMTNNTRLSFSAQYSDIIGVDPVAVAYSPHAANGYLRSACLLSNSQAVLPVLQRATSKAAQMYHAGAYLHQYRACGLEDDSFQYSFRQMGQVIENYRSI